MNKNTIIPMLLFAALSLRAQGQNTTRIDLPPSPGQEIAQKIDAVVKAEVDALKTPLPTDHDMLLSLKAEVDDLQEAVSQLPSIKGNLTVMPASGIPTKMLLDPKTMTWVPEPSPVASTLQRQADDNDNARDAARFRFVAAMEAWARSSPICHFQIGWDAITKTWRVDVQEYTEGDVPYFYLIEHRNGITFSDAIDAAMADLKIIARAKLYGSDGSPTPPP